MGEARRRASQGLPPRQPKPAAKQDTSPLLVSWLPLTQNQTRQFMTITSRGAWIGIGGLVVIWLTIRFLGPALGWWTLADG